MHYNEHEISFKHNCFVLLSKSTNQIIAKRSKFTFERIPNLDTQGKFYEQYH